MRWSTVRGRWGWVPMAALLCSACAAKAPPAPIAPPPPTYEQKVAAILRLEDRRVIEDAAAPTPAPAALAALLTDQEGRVRRRAALGVGRAGLSAGIAPLSSLLAGDPEPEVRAMAAFALGLIGDAAAAPVLTTALADADPRIQGRAAEALGLIAHKAAAAAVAQMVAAHISAGALTGIDSDELGHPLAPAVEAVRLGIYALVRLGDMASLKTAMLAANGGPASDWWPLAYAMQRIGHADALPVLRGWLGRGGAYTRAFAVKGIGGLKDQASRAPLETLAADARQPLTVRVQAVRALGAIADAQSAPALTALLPSSTPAVLRLEAAAAIRALARPALAESLIDYLEDDWAPMRAAAQSAMAASDADAFMPVLSGLFSDPEWSVRAALATTLGTLTPEAAGPRLSQLGADADPKVIAAALKAMTALKLPGVEARLTNALAHADVAVRIAGAEGLAALKPAGAAAALAKAFEASGADTTYSARAAMLAALVAIEGPAAQPRLTAALADPQWPVRIRAANLLAQQTPPVVAAATRPAPPNLEPALDAVDAMATPRYSPHAYVRTSKGEFRVELAVLDAPRTVTNFVTLVAKGFFDGARIHRVVADFVVQDGDPRGDGEGGPGYAIRDELNQRPYLRGTVGMALDWKDTAGSQFFITHSPQPHLDARYTVFGQVVEGMAVVDRLEPWDVIEAIRVWDGERWIVGPPRSTP
jgi:cyclophilin family peptidyl-prolyl cis-trans isomerase/HEAT repeat protein